MTEHRRRAQGSRRGSASVLALFVILLIGGLTVAFLQVGVSFNRSQSSRLEDERAFYLAEAGLEECLAALRGGGTGQVGTEDLPARMGDGCFWVEVSDIGNDVLLAKSNAMAGSR